MRLRIPRFTVPVFFACLVIVCKWGLTTGHHVWPWLALLSVIGFMWSWRWSAYHDGRDSLRKQYVGHPLKSKHGPASLEKMREHLGFNTVSEMADFAIDLLEYLWHRKIQGHRFFIKRKDEGGIRELNIEFQPKLGSGEDFDFGFEEKEY